MSAKRTSRTFTVTWHRDSEHEWLWRRDDGAYVMIVGTTEDHTTWQAFTPSRTPLYGPKGYVRNFRSRDAAMHALDTERPPLEATA